jgi:acyl-CoA thioester hydrolase
MGIVYHANYLKYLERARTEYIGDRWSAIEGYHERGCYFMVNKMDIAFHAPAKLGDLLVIRTSVENSTKFRVVLRQIILKKGEPRDYLVTARVTLVTVSRNGELMELPSEFHGQRDGV